jgi:hypothetical protein
LPDCEFTAKGDFQILFGFNVATLPGTAGVACRVASAVRTSVEKLIELLARAFDVVMVVGVVGACFMTALARFSET